MKLKLLYGTLIVLFATLLFACNDCDENDANSLVINKGAEFLSLDHQSRTGDLSVRSSRSWTLSCDAPWISFSARKGTLGVSNIKITLEQNDAAARFTTLKFSNGMQSVDFVVSQSAANTDFDSPTHYFYVTFSTMPTLYAGMFMLAYSKPSYFIFERTQTFDPAKFPAYVTPAPYYTSDEPKMHEYVKEQVRNINRDNPTAVFGLMTDDMRSRFSYDWFVAQGIDSSRVKVTLLSDGTATYNDFYRVFGSSASAESNWTQTGRDVDQLNWNHDGRYPVTRAQAELNSFTWSFYLATRPNYRLLLQYGSLLETDSPFMHDQITKMDMLSITPYELLDELTNSSKAQFYNMANFDYIAFAAMFDASTKPNLIIIGTSGKAAEQRVYTERIYQEYGATHDIFFKPHPADTSSDDYETVFPGLKLLPRQMPFEIFVWALLDKIDVIGGFPSTVFLTVPIDKVGFIFAPNAQSLVRPLNQLFENATVEWIQ